MCIPLVTATVEGIREAVQKSDARWRKSEGEQEEQGELVGSKSALWWHLIVFMLALTMLLAPTGGAQEKKTFRVPFHSIQGMVLLNAKVNGKPAVMFLDTGANVTVLCSYAFECSGARPREALEAGAESNRR